MSRSSSATISAPRKTSGWSSLGYRTYTCPIARECGGCEWLAVPYPIQLKRKRAEMERLFAAFIDKGAELDDIAGMEEPVAYRHKAATPFAPGKGRRVRSGFYAAGTHRIVACEKCLVEDARCRPVLNAVARAAEELGISAYDEDRGRGSLRHAVVRTAHTGNEALLTLVTNGAGLRAADELAAAVRAADPGIVGIIQNINQRRTNAILGDESRVLWGADAMHDTLLGCRFEIGATSFYQTNPAQTEVLYRLAIEGAALESGIRVLDAYCGCGTIGICAAAATEGVRVVGVETVPEAVERARANAQANGVGDRCSFVRADATRWMLGAAKRGERFDVVILDPPRAGSTPEFLAAAASLSPERIVYVSCNPVTQARDLELLGAHSYRLVRLSPVDMFPHTKHVETVVLMTKK